MKKVILADDHPIFRAGLRSILEETGEYIVVAEVSDGEACIAQAELLSPDILIIDLAMPEKNGYEVAEWVRTAMPHVDTLIVSMYSDTEFVQRAKEVGSKAFIAKENAGTELIKALQAPGSDFFMSSSAGKHVPAFVDPYCDASQLDQLTKLSISEIKVLKLVTLAKTSKEIANELGLSYRTIQTHRQNISNKLDIHGANGLIQFAIQYRDEIDSFEPQFQHETSANDT